MHGVKRPHASPAPEPSKRQRQDRALCPTEEPHNCTSSTSGGKKKYYTVWGGPNPGVHLTDWTFARTFIEGFSVKQRSFANAKDASVWYQIQKQREPVLAPRWSNQGTASINQPSAPSHVSAPSNPYSNPGAHQPAQQHPIQQPHTARSTASSHEADYIPLDDGLGPSEPGLPQTNGQAIPPPAPGPQPQAIAALQEPPLSAEQARLVDIIVRLRKNVFYTGSAGVGKSRVLKAFRRQLAALGLKVNVVAPTGRAALDINGQTTWSYAGWTPDSMKKPLKDLRREAWKKTVKKRLQKTDVLVIDEISMVENLHLERLSEIMKEVRQNGKAFGGVQVVITGDFCQLPPVSPFKNCIDCGKFLEEKARKSAYECPLCKKIYNDEDKWAFQSNTWREADFEHINLETIFRQRDRAFIDILQKLRLGKPLLVEEKNLLCQSKPNIDKAVKLFPLRADVRRINDLEFRKLKTHPRLYHSIDNFEQQNHHGGLQFYNNRSTTDGTLIKLAEHRYEPHLELKEGMLVVLLANLSISGGLVNGSQGTIIGFEKFWSEEEEQEPDEKKIAHIEDLLEGEYKPYRARRIFDFMTAAAHKAWPVVRFFHQGMVKEVKIEASCFPTEVGDEPPTNPRYSLLSRTQIPLMAAWAMTIHKSQGMTLEKVEVDLGKNFEEGMAHVALSRATSPEGLKVHSFPENAEMGSNEEVRNFLREKLNLD